jgi:hypothetical protein
VADEVKKRQQEAPSGPTTGADLSAVLDTMIKLAGASFAIEMAFAWMCRPTIADIALDVVPDLAAFRDQRQKMMRHGQRSQM